MKKIILILLLISFFSETRTQTYFPFQTDTAQWNVDSYDGSRDRSYQYTYFYFINGDTIIDTIQYSKIYRSKAAYDTIIDTIGAYYQGGLREDNNKHIYFKPGEMWQYFSLNCGTDYMSIDELLLYRFDITVGDTFRLNQYSSNSFLHTVLNIDSILIGSEYRKRYKIQSDNYALFNDYWIEGLGSQFSPFGPFCYFFEGWDRLLCYRDPNTNYVGHYNEEEECIGYVVGNVESLIHKINIYPNPAKSIVNIETYNKEKIININIYNLFGQLVFNKNRIDIAINQVDISSLQHGLYIIEIKLNNLLIRQKLIVE